MYVNKLIDWLWNPKISSDSSLPLQDVEYCGKELSNGGALTPGFIQSDGLYEAERRHEELPLVLQRTEEAKSVFMGRHVRISIIQTIVAGGLQTQTHTIKTYFKSYQQGVIPSERSFI